MPSSTFKLLAATLLITLIIFINPFNNCYYDFNRNSHHSPVLLNDLTLSLSNTSALLLSAFSHDILLSNDIRSTYRDLDYLWNDYPYLPLLDTKANYITYCSGSKPQPQYQPQCDLHPRFYSLMTRMLNIRTQVLSSLSLHALDIEILDTKTQPYLKPPRPLPNLTTQFMRARACVINRRYTYGLSQILRAYERILTRDEERLQILHADLTMVLEEVEVVQGKVWKIITSRAEEMISFNGSSRITETTQRKMFAWSAFSRQQSPGSDSEGGRDGYYLAPLPPAAPRILYLFSLLSQRTIIDSTQNLLDLPFEVDGWEVWNERSRENWARIARVRGVVKVQTDIVRGALKEVRGALMRLSE